MIDKERCQSGWMGRSRKPLYGQLYPGFESLSLRKPVNDPANAGHFCFHERAKPALQSERKQKWKWAKRTVIYRLKPARRRRLGSLKIIPFSRNIRLRPPKFPQTVYDSPTGKFRLSVWLNTPNTHYLYADRWRHPPVKSRYNLHFFTIFSYRVFSKLYC